MIPDHSYRLRPLEERDVWDILSWRYPSPYDFYNPPKDDRGDYYVSLFLDPDLAFHAIVDGEGNFVGFCSFGRDGQVPGGDYREEALDIGLGMRPELTGQGMGSAFFNAILDYARLTFSPDRIRLTVASFNERAMSLYRRSGFRAVDEFFDSFLEIEYVVLMKDA